MIWSQALEIYLAIGFGAGVGFLFRGLFTTISSADASEEIMRANLKLDDLVRSRALNRALTEENELLQAELSELNALRRDGGSSLRRNLQ